MILERRSKMKIAIIHQFVRKGGADYAIIRMAKYLHAKNNNVNIFWIGPFSYSEDFGQESLKVHKIKFNLINLIFFRLLYPKIIKTIINCDVVIFSNTLPIFNLAIMPCLKNQLKVWYCHEPNRIVYDKKILKKFIFDKVYTKEKIKSGSNTLSNMQEGSILFKKIAAYIYINNLTRKLLLKFMELLDKRIANRYDVIFTNSQAIKELVHQLYNVTNVYVIYPGINLDEFPPLKSDFPVQPTFIYIGALTPEKNIDSIIRAFKLANLKLTDSKLKIIGEGQCKEKLIKISKNLNLQDKVQFLGHIPYNELLKELSKSTALIHAAFFEPFGLTILEAALLSKPAIVSNIGGPIEIVKDKETGVLVNPYSVDSIAEGMLFVLENFDNTKKFGINAKERVIEKFSLNGSIDEMIKILNLGMRERYL